MNLDEIVATIQECPKVTVLVDNFQPMAAPRPKVGRFGTYMPKSYKEYKIALGEAIQRFFLENDMPMSIGDKPWAMYAVFGFRYPKSHPQYARSPESFTQDDLGDSDNLVKGVMDTLQDIQLLSNDALIASVLPAKVRTSGDSFIKFTVYSIPKVRHLSEESTKRLWSIICNKEQRKLYPKELKEMSKRLFG